MERLIVTSRTDADGVLRVNIPLGDAAQEVKVTIEPIGASSPTPMTPEKWPEFIKKFAGSITDPTFMRHDQGEFEVRESLP